jgi:hypothetical protein
MAYRLHIICVIAELEDGRYGSQNLEIIYLWSIIELPVTQTIQGYSKT